jgi:hypothetical protein
MSDSQSAFEQELESQFQSQDAVASEQSVQQETQTQSTPEPEKVNVLGRELLRDEAEALLEFLDWARANPEYLAAFDSYLAGEAELVPRGQKPPAQPPATSASAPPAPELATSQPAPSANGKAAPLAAGTETDELTELRRQVAEMRQHFATQQMAAARAAVLEGQQRFAKQWGLTDQEIEDLSNVAARLGVVAQLAQQTGDMTTAVERALELAMWSEPAWRERALRAQEASEAAERERQRKASSLAGSAATISGSMNAPQTPEARREAMVAEIAEALRGGSLQT